MKVFVLAVYACTWWGRCEVVEPDPFRLYQTRAECREDGRRIARRMDADAFTVYCHPYTPRAAPPRGEEQR